MHTLTKPALAVALSVSLLAITGCATSNLQGSRLDAAEEHLIQAERASASNKVTLADNNLGVATAYLATLKDNKKRLTESQKKRYQTLLQREKNLARKIQAMK